MNADAVLDFIEEIGVLKNLPRTGWRFRGIKDAESIAESLLSGITFVDDFGGCVDGAGHSRWT